MDEWDVRRGALDALVPATGSVALHGLRLAAWVSAPLVAYAFVTADPGRRVASTGVEPSVVVSTAPAPGSS